jgi:cytochrome c oxidase assembly factor CtaG
VLAHVAHYWQLDPPLLAIGLAAVLYAVGLRRRVSRRREAGAEAALFAAGLAVLALAFAPPLATVESELFWAHMTQHVLMLAVAPPLILLGRPWSTIARALPVSVRRPTARGVARGSWASPLRRAARASTSPPAALGLFSGLLVAWHLPVLYDATLRSSGVHVLEHSLFLATGLLFWSQLIDSPPFRSRLDYLQRALYAVLGTAAGSAVGLVLALASSPLYSEYAALRSRPGGISPLADQHLAAGIMLVPGSIPFLAACVVFLYRWLDVTAQDGRRVTSRLAGDS